MRLTDASANRRPATDERGAVAIVVALSMVMLLVVAAMVLDFGVVRVDRQRAKSTADSAVMAGMRAADGKTGDVYSFRAVCAALSFLRVNDDRMSGLPAGVCATPDNTVKCNSAAPAANPAVYDGTVTNAGTTYRVVIKSPYSLSDGGFAEETYATSTGDPSLASGCDQVGVIISESRKPGLGSLATSGDLRFSVRSVGRATLGGSDDLAPALILLERTACSVLTVGSAGAGAGSYIKVLGYAKTPGSIHVDSAATGSDCGSGSNKQLFQGKQADGIVAYGSKSPTGTAGIITLGSHEHRQGFERRLRRARQRLRHRRDVRHRRDEERGHRPRRCGPRAGRRPLPPRRSRRDQRCLEPLDARLRRRCRPPAGKSPTARPRQSSWLSDEALRQLPAQQRHHAQRQDHPGHPGLLQRFPQGRHGFHAQCHPGLRR